MVGEIKGHRLWRFPGKVPPSLFLRPDVLLSLFSEIFYGHVPKAIILACRF